MKVSVFEKGFSRGFIVVLGVVLLYLAFRVYDNFATTGIMQITAWILEIFPRPWHGIYWSVSLLLKVPFIITNSIVVGLILSMFFHRALWKYGLAVGIVSEIIWIIVWCVYIYGDLALLVRAPILVEQAITVLGPAFGGYCIETIYHKWRSKDENRLAAPATSMNSPQSGSNHGQSTAANSP